MKFLITALLLFWGATFASADSFVVPPLTGPVVDRAGFLSPDAESKITQYLQSLKQRGGSQIQVLILPNLSGLEIEDASIKVTDAWKLGDAKTDRGVLLILGLQERRLRIEVGQGLEGELPDAYAKRIVADVITPRLKAGQPDEAISAGVQAIASITDPNLAGTANPEKLYQVSRERKKRSGGMRDIAIFIIVLIAMIIMNRGGRGGGRGFGAGLAGGLLGGALGGRGGGGGGGWSGGGGGFSGGGASGSW